MTKDDICKWIHMAWDFTSEDTLKRKFEYQEAHYIPYEKFARLVAEHEREACAKVCDAVEDSQDEYRGAVHCAKEIRARGEK